ncbi:MAG TPA: cytochrome c [candidate division Zixibacteria bacterium]|nr:cytochrome c [candidate division Zixibacteria bacterium]
MNKLKILIFIIVLGVIVFLVVKNFYGKEFQSNGERIYFTSTSNSSKPITASIGNMTLGGGAVSCARCHGEDGKGMSGMFMMWKFEAPDIRYSTLTETGHGGHGTHEESEKPYTDELIKRAILQGLDPEGKHLEPPMPQFNMPESDLNDLIEYLKTI